MNCWNKIQFDFTLIIAYKWDSKLLKAVKHLELIAFEPGLYKLRSLLYLLMPTDFTHILSWPLNQSISGED